VASKGVFISFEGGEGSGKSTLIAAIERELKALSCRVRVTREPGGVEISEIIRSIVTQYQMDPFTELLLYNASRREYVVTLVEPALLVYDFVLTDRFYDSTTAYQGYGRGIDITTIDQAIRIAVGNLKPDRTYLLDVDPEIGLVRATKPGVETNKFELETLEFHRRVNSGFLKKAAEEPERFCVVDANRDADEVFIDVWLDIKCHFDEFLD
jgi:dTMP kinase